MPAAGLVPNGQFPNKGLLSLVLLRNGVVVPSRTVLPSNGGPATVQDIGPVSPDGTYVYTVEQQDTAGNVGAPSTPLSVSFVTAPPPAPSLVLDPNSDTGTKGDNVTSNVFPTIDVSGAVGPLATVVLLRDGNLAGYRTGPGPITSWGPVPDGTHTYRVYQIDDTGNAGPLSAPLSVTILTQKPAAPGAPVLDPSSDTSFYHNQWITSATNQLFDVPNVAANMDVVLVRDPGTPNQAYVANVISATAGTVYLRDPFVPQGTHFYTAVQIDGAGNFSNPSPVAAATATHPSYVTTITTPPYVNGFTYATNRTNQLTSITVNFSEALAHPQLLSANNNIFPFYAFHLYSPRGELFFRYGTYSDNGTAHTVTLVPTNPVALNQNLTFVINSPSVIFDLALNQLDGAYTGRPGSGPYVTTIPAVVTTKSVKAARAASVSAAAFDALSTSPSSAQILGVVPASKKKRG